MHLNLWMGAQFTVRLHGEKAGAFYRVLGKSGIERKSPEVDV